MLSTERSRCRAEPSESEDSTTGASALMRCVTRNGIVDHIWRRPPSCRWLRMSFGTQGYDVINLRGCLPAGNSEKQHR